MSKIKTIALAIILIGYISLNGAANGPKVNFKDHYEGIKTHQPIKG